MTDIQYMEAALIEARKGWGKTHLNPMVGAVIVEGSTLVSSGHHAVYGGPHAEVDALRKLGRRPSRGAVMYVTLEPCSSLGKTGPCTQAILDAGIRKVVVGAIDPDQRHQGKGVGLLEAAGVQVSVGLLKESCEDLNLIFNHVAKTAMPLLAAKTATTLDGKVATRKGRSKWITGEQARMDVMHWRKLFPSIAVGAGTVLADNPNLTSRIAEAENCSTRFIFDRRLNTVSMLGSAKVFNDAYKDRTVVVTVNEARGTANFIKHGIEVWQLTGDSHGFWIEFKERCMQKQIAGVYFEGGPGLLSDLLSHRQLDYFFAYRAPKFFADAAAPAFADGQVVEDMNEAFSLSRVRHSIFGEDQMTRGFVTYPHV